MKSMILVGIQFRFKDIFKGSNNNIIMAMCEIVVAFF